jgi:hypothetical protein
MCGAIAAADVDPVPARESGLRLSVNTRLLGPAALLVALAGCSSAGQEPTGLGSGDPTTQAASAEPSAVTTSPSETSASAPSGGTLTPAALPPGLVFEDLPAASGNAAAALAAYLGLEAEIWRSFLAGRLSPDMATYATAPVVADFEVAFESQRNQGMVGGGNIVITPTLGRVSDQLVLIDACADMSELTNILDGKESPPPEVVENPTWVVEALVMADQASGGGWKVSEYRQEPRTC